MTSSLLELLVAAKNIPEGVNKRLSSRSSNEEMFEIAAPTYREALAKSGYSYELKFDPNANKPSKKKKNQRANRKKIWFNPPYSAAIRTNIGQEFLKLVEKSFPHGHPLKKIFNRNTVKIGYSCAPNIASIISSKNKNILAPINPEERLCSCSRTKTCPLEGQCLAKNVIYQATVTQENGTQNSYTGLSSTEFKKRLAVHKSTFKNENFQQTSLSRFIWNLKRKNVNYEVKWKIQDRGATFSPITGRCGLCIKEKFCIMFKPESADINSRDEIFSSCIYKKSKLLIPRERKNGPG